MDSLWIVLRIYLRGINIMIELYCLVLNCSHFHSPRYILIKNYRVGLYFLMEKRNKVQLPAGGLFLPAKRNKTLEEKKHWFSVRSELNMMKHHQIRHYLNLTGQRLIYRQGVWRAWYPRISSYYWKST